MRLPARILCSTALLLSACSTVSGGGDRAVAEFAHYRDAARMQREAGTLVLDRLAAAERRLLALEKRASGPDTNFDPDGAAAYLGVGDPPRTAALRRGLRTLDAWTEALARLGSGEAPRSLSAGLVAATTNLVATGRLLGAGRPGAVAGFEALAATLDRALPLLGALAAQTDGAALREALVAAQPAMRDLLAGLRAATPAIWRVLRAGAVEPGRLDVADGIGPATRARLEADRRLLAGWVVLIDQSARAMDAALAAARSGERADIGNLVAASLRLRVLAETVQAARTR